MAGKKVRNYLNARGFDAFYDLYHGLSKRIIIRSSNIAGYAELIRCGYKENPAVLSDARACADLDVCATLTKEANQSIRDFFWPRSSEHIQDINLQLKFWTRRWEPFDEAAWDSFFAQMAALLETSLQTVRDCHGKIEAYSAGQTHTSEVIPNLLTSIEKSCNELSEMCDQEKVEFDTFNNWFQARIRQVSDVVWSSLQAIQRSHEGNPGIFPEVGFRADLEAFVALARDFDPLTELYKNPKVIERMLLDKELLAGHRLPRNETAWDSVWAEMAGVYGVFGNRLREHLQKLKTYSLGASLEADRVSGELATIEQFLDNLSHILLEMNDLAPLACSSGGQT